MSIAVIVSSASVTFTGVATPLLVLGSVLATIGAGLLYTLDIGTGSGHWIGYQILAGLGWGAGFQIPIIIGQGTADAADIAPVTAIIVCKLHPMRPLRVWTNGNNSRHQSSKLSVLRTFWQRRRRGSLTRFSSRFR